MAYRPAGHALESSSTRPWRQHTRTCLPHVSMRCLCTYLYTVHVYAHVCTHRTQAWLTNDLDDGYLERLFFILAAMMALNTAAFAVAARNFRYACLSYSRAKRVCVDAKRVCVDAKRVCVDAKRVCVDEQVYRLPCLFLCTVCARAFFFYNTSRLFATWTFRVFLWWHTTAHGYIGMAWALRGLPRHRVGFGTQ